jgi:hypothetical protein
VDPTDQRHQRNRTRDHDTVHWVPPVSVKGREHASVRDWQGGPASRRGSPVMGRAGGRSGPNSVA